MKVDLKIEFKRTQPRLGAAYTNCEVGDGVVVGYVHQPTQSKTYTGPRFRADTVLPGIRIKDGIMDETEELARERLENAVRAWFQRCGVVAPSAPAPDDVGRPV